MKKRLLALILALVMVCGAAPAAAAASGEAQAAAQTLYELGLFNGTGTDSAGNPIFSLDEVPSREQAVTMLVRLLGKDSEAKAGKWSIPFTDVSDWAVPYVGYAYANGLTSGTTATTFGGSQNATPAQYITFVLRALGYSSDSDFRWDAPWQLSDRIGLTDGQYPAGSGTFTRGDIAVISATALDICLKGSSKTLRSTLPSAQPAVPPPVQTTATRDTYLQRKLTNEQLAQLKEADAQQLRSAISTVADAVAYLDQFEPTFWTSDGQHNLAAEHALEQVREKSTATPTLYTGFTGWCLSDDNPSIQYLAAYVEHENSLSATLALPISGGWLILTPSQLSPIAESVDFWLIELEEVQVKTLDTLKPVLRVRKVHSDIISIFLGPVGQDLSFEWKKVGLLSGSAQEVYTITEAEIAATQAQEREERWQRLMGNWSKYEMPDSQKPTMTRAQVEALLGKDLDTVAAAVKNLGDCMAYLCLSLYEGKGEDIQFEVGDTDLYWHFNYSPQAVFANNWGNCGATSGLAAYLLQGDYDVTGIIGITFAEGEGGGHVINYLRDGDHYYVFDLVNLVSGNFSPEGFRFTEDSTLQKAAMRWSNRSGWEETLMYAYQSFDGDAPVGWDKSHISYLPDRYRDTAIILMETPEEGYVYQWVDLNPYVQMVITGLRNIY